MWPSSSPSSSLLLGVGGVGGRGDGGGEGSNTHSSGCLPDSLPSSSLLPPPSCKCKSAPSLRTLFSGFLLAFCRPEANKYIAVLPSLVAPNRRM